MSHVTIRTPASSGSPFEVTELPVEVGEFVEVGQIIVRYETEKAYFEMPSYLAGRVSQILVTIGQFIESDDPLMVLDINLETIDDANSKTN